MSDKKTHKTKDNKERGRGVYKKAELEEYGLFMALPRKDRKELFGFDTDAVFAKEKGLNPGTLSDWKMRDELWEIRDRYMLHFKKHTAEIIGKLAERAKRSGEAFHTQTYMKLVEGWVEKSGIDLTTKGKKITGFNVVIRHAKHSPTSTRNEDK